MMPQYSFQNMTNNSLSEVHHELLHKATINDTNAILKLHVFNKDYHPEITYCKHIRCQHEEQ